MKLKCKNCEEQIQNVDINIGEGVCKCSQCGEVFLLSSLLSSEPTSIPSPLYSNINVDLSDARIIVNIPPRGWASAIGLWFFSVGWTIAVFVFMSQEDNSQLMMWVFLAMLVPGFGIAVAALFLSIGQTEILLHPASGLVTQKLLSFKHEKWFPVTSRTQVREVIVYSLNYQPVYGVSMKLDDKKEVQFGSGLDEHERKWVIINIKLFLAKSVPETGRS